MDEVRLVEVGPRDGLQTEPRVLPPAVRAGFVERLLAAGLGTVEAGGFVSPRWVPQMAGTDAVLRALGPRPGVRLPVLVPDLAGHGAARAAGARGVALFLAASETVSRRNLHCSVAGSVERARPVAERARAEGVRLRGSVSCVLGCPVEGPVAVGAVVAVAEALVALGCEEVSLGDTIGAGTPRAARALVRALVRAVGAAVGAAGGIGRVAAHFHDTGGRALAHLDAAREEGARTVDGAAGGLGGCPSAPGAPGNVATEAVVDWLEGRGVRTGVDRDALAAAAAVAPAALGRPGEGPGAGGRA